MKPICFIQILFCFNLAVSAFAVNHADHPPNIILILADDLGYGELGCYGQKLIETPNINALAKAGMRFTQSYCGSPVCAPSRCILLTGLHSGHAQIRGNDEWRLRGEVWSYRRMIEDSTLEGQAPMKPGTETAAGILQKKGYSTAIVGKWGLGAPHTESIPNEMGFDYFYGYNCQRQAHTYYPFHLWEDRARVYLGNDIVPPNTKLPEGADPLSAESYRNFTLEQYAPDLMIEAARQFIINNQHQPFFLYFASPLPHVPLQAPDKWVQYYVNKFGDEPPYSGSKGYFPQRYPHAAYAAMVSCLDEQVGKLIHTLKQLGIYDNTLIIFTSDNGPSYAGGADSPWFSSGGPFPSDYGRGKGFLYEGGIRVPMIASWPGHIHAGTFNDVITCFQDIFPTLSEVTGAVIPDNIDGISQLPSLLGEEPASSHPYLYWEFPEYGGQQAVRMGKWKAIRKDIRKGNLDFELYNLETDKKEEHNVAKDHPEIIQRIKEICITEHVRSGNPVFHLKALGD